MKRVRLTRTQQQAQTRERLLAAAETVFSRLGYGGASVDLVAAEAGYSKGAIYSNFESKEAIFLELLRLHMDRVLAELEAIVEMDPEKVATAIAEWLRTMHARTDSPTLIVELELHARRDSTFAKDFYALQERKLRALAGIVTKYFEARRASPPMDAMDLARVIEALANGLSLQRSAGARGAATETGCIIDALLTVLVRR